MNSRPRYTRNASSAKCLYPYTFQPTGIAERYRIHSDNPPRTATISLPPIRLISSLIAPNPQTTGYSIFWV